MSLISNLILEPQADMGLRILTFSQLEIDVLTIPQGSCLKPGDNNIRDQILFRPSIPSHNIEAIRKGM